MTPVRRGAGLVSEREIVVNRPFARLERSAACIRRMVDAAADKCHEFGSEFIRPRVAVAPLRSAFLRKQTQMFRILPVVPENLRKFRDGAEFAFVNQHPDGGERVHHRAESGEHDAAGVVARPRIGDVAARRHAVGHRRRKKRRRIDLIPEPLENLRPFHRGDEFVVELTEVFRLEFRVICGKRTFGTEPLAGERAAVVEHRLKRFYHASPGGHGTAHFAPENRGFVAADERVVVNILFRFPAAAEHLERQVVVAEYNGGSAGPDGIRHLAQHRIRRVFVDAER